MILEIAALMAFEAGVIIEGLSLDVFGMSEDLARQASSTVLAVFTISCAVGVTVGGLIYDFFGWQGMSIFHTGCAAVLLLLFIFQPTCRVSFYEYFWPIDFEDGEEWLNYIQLRLPAASCQVNFDDEEEETTTSVVPSAPAKEKSASMPGEVVPRLFSLMNSLAEEVLDLEEEPRNLDYRIQSIKGMLACCFLKNKKGV